MLHYSLHFSKLWTTLNAGGAQNNLLSGRECREDRRSKTPRLLFLSVQINFYRYFRNSWSNMDEISCVKSVCCGDEGSCIACELGSREGPVLPTGVNEIT